MYVTVFLTDARVHTVVPSSFVKELVKVNLFNKGINTYQKRLIFFSKEIFDLLESGEISDSLEFVPKFSSPKTNVYPPADVDVCYNGRLIKFWTSFNEALDHAERLRSQMPASYNPNREHEQPIPPTDHQIEGMVQHGDEETIGNTEDDIAAAAAVATVSGDSNDSEQEVDDDSNVAEQADEKPIFEEVLVPEADMSALDSLFNERNNLTAASISSQNIDIQPDDRAEDENSSTQSFSNDDESVSNTENLAHETSASLDGSQSLTHITIEDEDGDDIVMGFKSESDFRPMMVNDGYQIKLNDWLSSNWPFKENSNGDRSYKIELKDKQIKDLVLPAKAVAGLIKLNQEKRSNILVDKVFLKCLLIGICSLIRIRTSGTSFSFLEGEKEFIQNLHEFRVSSDDINGLRKASFERILNEARIELQLNRY